MLSNELELCLQSAFHEAREARHVYLTAEHLLLGILDTPRVNEILRACGADLVNLKKELKEHIDRATPQITDGENGEPQPTLGFQRTLQRAVFHVQSSGKKEVGVMNVLVALYSEKQSHAVFLLQRQHVTRLDVINYISHGLVRDAQESLSVPREEPVDLSGATEALQQGTAQGVPDSDQELTRFTHALLDRAVKDRASEVHIEPFAGRVVIRFRVQGALREVLQQPQALAPRLARGMKRLAGLATDSLQPQDARISLRGEGGLLDLRVATLPSRHGERVALYLEPGHSDFESLGMNANTAQQLESLLGKPGLVIITGPAGSGRTTALYTALARFDVHLLNIMTVEDCIERSLDGVTQTEVSAQLNPGQALAAVLRHEPDIIMLNVAGELPKQQVFSLAVAEAVKVSASKRVFLSLDAPTAAAAITRLIDLGVAPALLAEVLRGVLALRRVRRLDPATREAFQPGEYERRFLGLQPEDPAPQIYRARKDEVGQGFTGIHELVVVGEALRTLIRGGGNTQALEQQARQSSVSLREAARAKILNGETSIEEVVRVLGED